ncbi:peptidylprolyl isomerase [bacterium]|nr:peptidylprolyl isomerase [bacterium]MBU1917668.1 peptidylprolyl isomerase [bacterium]
MIKKGSKVTIHYTLAVNDQLLENTRDNEPLTFVQGSGQLMKGIDKNMVGLKTGDTKSFTVAPDEAFGPIDETAVTELPRTAFDEPEKIIVGGIVQGKQGDHNFQATVKAVTDETITLDFNHPLAGKTITFDIEVMSVDEVKA